MADRKKDFKGNPALSFISDTGAPQGTQTVEKLMKPSRMQLRLDAGLKEYLDDVRWVDRKSATRYINDLIEADRVKREIKNRKCACTLDK